VPKTLPFVAILTNLAQLLPQVNPVVRAVEDLELKVVTSPLV
jgi:hypothetical protein